MSNSDHTTIPNKICTRCKSIYPASPEYFNTSKTGRNGLHSYCRHCSRAKSREYHAANKQKSNEKARKWRERNPEKKKEYAKQWHADNREKENQRNREWKKSHPDYRKAHRVKEREQVSRYRQINREKVRVWSRRGKARYRARKLQGELVNVHFDELAQLKRQHGKCYYCGEIVGKKYHIDHVVPLSRGGSDHPDNKVIACPRCNVRKNSKLPHEWIEGGRLL